MYLHCNLEDTYLDYYVKSYAFSVRCLKDSP